MKKLTLDTEETTPLKLVSKETPIFVKEHGKLVGMLVDVTEQGNKKGCALALGGPYFSNGFHDTRKECIESNFRFGYEFYIEE